MQTTKTVKLRRREVDFLNGKLLKKIILYALPIVGVNVLQLLFTATDVAILGIFTNDNAVAAVGATTVIINLIIGFFIGLATGVNVLVARCIGEQNIDKANRIVGTAIFISIVLGFVALAIGEILAEQILVWTNCDSSVLPYATTYLRIYFIGMPIIMLYNFTSAILRAVGDTLRPLIFLIIGGVVNVILNIFFVVVLHYDIEGVAIATVVSNAISAICACVLMSKNDSYARIKKSNIRFFKKEFSEIFVIGLPISIAKCFFSFANVMVQSNLNALGGNVMTAQSITKEFDGFILEAVHGFGAANLVVISQNYGAKKMNRVKKIAFISFGLMSVVCAFLGAVLLFFGRTFCSIMTDTEAVLDYCMIRITTVSIAYIALGFVSVVQETIRGIGYSATALFISILANVLLRIIYMTFVYPIICLPNDIAQNLRMLYLLYPVSWLIAGIIGLFILIFLFKKVKKRFETEKEQETLQKDNTEIVL